MRKKKRRQIVNNGLASEPDLSATGTTVTGDVTRDNILVKMGVYTGDSRRTDNPENDLVILFSEELIFEMGNPSGILITRTGNDILLQFGNYKFSKHRPNQRTINRISGARGLPGVRVPGSVLRMHLPRTVDVVETRGQLTSVEKGVMSIHIPDVFFKDETPAEKEQEIEKKRRKRRSPGKSIPPDAHSELKNAAMTINKAVDKAAVIARIDNQGHVRLRVQVEI